MYCPSQRGQARLIENASGLQHRVVRDAGAAQPEEGKASERVETVACVDSLARPPVPPHRGSMVALRVAVLDVVVDEGEVVDKLDGRGGWEGALHVAA